jgi:hypothetical protein
MMPMAMTVVTPARTPRGPPERIIAMEWPAEPAEIKVSIRRIGIIIGIVIGIRERSVVIRPVVGNGLGPKMEKLARDDRGLIFRLSNLQGFGAEDFPHGGDIAPTGVNSRVQAAGVRDQESPLRPARIHRHIPIAQGLLEHLDLGLIRQVFRLDDLPAQQHHSAQISIGVHLELCEGDGSIDLFPQFPRHDRSASPQEKQGNQEPEGEGLKAKAPHRSHRCPLAFLSSPHLVLDHLVGIGDL